jgi:hypothetical protein
MSEGRGPGEGIRKEGEGPGEGQHGPEHKTPVAQREISQKEQGNPAERQKEQERVNRDEGLHQGGFPVAGHGEPERDNHPGRERSRSRR